MTNVQRPTYRAPVRCNVIFAVSVLVGGIVGWMTLPLAAPSFIRLVMPGSPVH